MCAAPSVSARRGVEPDVHVGAPAPQVQRAAQFGLERSVARAGRHQQRPLQILLTVLVAMQGDVAAEVVGEGLAQRRIAPLELRPAGGRDHRPGRCGRVHLLARLVVARAPGEQPRRLAGGELPRGAPVHVEDGVGAVPGDAPLVEDEGVHALATHRLDGPAVQRDDRAGAHPPRRAQTPHSGSPRPAGSVRSSS